MRSVDGRMARRTRGDWAVLLLVFLALLLRLWQLDTVPPNLYYDEAGQGLDARDLLHGEVRAFFPRSMGKEPLYIYLTVPFVAAADTQPVAVRVAAALLGALTVYALYLAGRSLWADAPTTGRWVGLVAAALWVVNYWPQSVNRLGFRVNTLPLLLTLAVVAWANWVRRPTRGRGVFFGFLAGATLLTYLAARMTPVLWPAFFLVALSPRQRRRVLPLVPWAVLGFLLGFGPLLVHFALRPEDAVQRVATFPVWEEARRSGNALALFLASLRDVLGGFLGWAGDPIPRHNIPGRPPFWPWLGPLFFAGLLLAVWKGIRGKDAARARVLLIWWGAMLVPAVLAAADNPHFLRLFGALPAALLLAAWPVAALLTRLHGARQRVALAVLLLLLAAEGGRTVRAYFVTWARETDLYTAFQQDMWTIGEVVRDTPDGIGIVPLNPYYGDTYREYVLQYVFRDVPILQMRVLEDCLEDWLEENLGGAGGKRVVVTVWRKGEHVNADPKDVLGFYLRREGYLERWDKYRGFDLLTYRLGRAPRFRVDGNRMTVRGEYLRGLTLVDARWGVAYPNPTREGTEVAAGTAVWAILTWRLDQPLPDLKVTLDAVDARGHRIASDERYLLDALRFPTSQWKPGTVGRSYHLLTVPTLHPPEQLVLESRAYEGASLIPIPPKHPTPRGSIAWGGVTVHPARAYPRPEEVEIAHPVRWSPEAGVTLLGLDPWPEVVAPGQDIPLRLYWHVTRPLTMPVTVELYLERLNARTAVTLPPTLPAGAVVYTLVDVPVPPDTGGGSYTLVLSSLAGERLPLGTVGVAGRIRRFTPPPVDYPARATFGQAITLLGMKDLKREGQDVRFTLVWQVSGPVHRELKRFVHVLGANGRPQAQEDTVPCRGDCPAASWLPGEVLLDEVHIVLPADMPRGSYPLAVGWYDAATLQRLPAYDAAGRRLPNDMLVLPERLEER